MANETPRPSGLFGYLLILAVFALCVLPAL